MTLHLRLRSACSPWRHASRASSSQLPMSPRMAQRVSLSSMSACTMPAQMPGDLPGPPPSLPETVESEWSERAQAIESTYNSIRDNALARQDESKSQSPHLMLRLSVASLSPELQQRCFQHVAWADSGKAQEFWNLMRAFWPNDQDGLKGILSRLPNLANHGSTETSADVFEISDLLNSALEHSAEIGHELVETGVEATGVMASSDAGANAELARANAQKMHRHIEREEEVLEFLEWLHKFKAWRSSMKTYCKSQAQFQNEIWAVYAHQRRMMCSLGVLLLASMLGLCIKFIRPDGSKQLDAASVGIASVKGLPDQCGTHMNGQGTDGNADSDAIGARTLTDVASQTTDSGGASPSSMAEAGHGLHGPSFSLTSKFRLGHADFYPCGTIHLSPTVNDVMCLLGSVDSTKGWEPERCRIDMHQEAASDDKVAASVASPEEATASQCRYPPWKFWVRYQVPIMTLPIGANSAPLTTRHADFFYIGALTCTKPTQTDMVPLAAEQIGADCSSRQTQTDDLAHSPRLELQQDPMKSARTGSDMPSVSPRRGLWRLDPASSSQASGLKKRPSPESLSRPSMSTVDTAEKMRGSNFSPTDVQPLALPFTADKSNVYEQWVEDEGGVWTLGDPWWVTPRAAPRDD